MVTFRPLHQDDFGLLSTWLERSHVQAWWRDPSAPEAVARKYGPRVRGESPTEVFIVGVDDRDVGMIQRYRIADHPEWLVVLAQTGFDAASAAGIDYFIGEPESVGRGVGTAMIRAFTDQLFADLPDVECVAVTPQSANIASCRVLEKAGYDRLWTGQLDSDDPADEGEAALYVRRR